MDVRADWALELQLAQVAEHAADHRVKEWIDKAIAHMAGGTGGNRRGGAELVALLAEARQRAADYDEWHVVRLLQDSIDYAEGRILRPIMEEQYRLFQDGLRNETKREYLAGTLSATLKYFADTGNGYMSEHPDATLPELLGHIKSLGLGRNIHGGSRGSARTLPNPTRAGRDGYLDRAGATRSDRCRGCPRRGTAASDVS